MESALRTLADIDWSRWSGVACTLVFVVREGEVLLIRKKRGLGAGKINGPGGKVDAGETPLAGAKREVREEVCAPPLGLAFAGRARFQFADGYATDVHVFRANGLEGTPAATPEADPFWVRLDAIPYREMWEDDSLWLPHLLAGRAFSGRFLFDGDKLLDWAIELARESSLFASDAERDDSRVRAKPAPPTRSSAGPTPPRARSARGPRR